MKDSKIQQVLDDVKSRYNVHEFIERDAQVGFKKKGQVYRGACPFHGTAGGKDVFAATDEWYMCHYAGCERSGDIVSYIMETRKCDFKTALDELSNGELSAYKLDRPKEKAPETPEITLTMADVELRAINAHEAFPYFESRGIPASQVKRWQIGVEHIQNRYLFDGFDRITIPHKRYAMPNIFEGEVFGIKLRLDTDDAIKQWYKLCDTHPTAWQRRSEVIERDHNVIPGTKQYENAVIDSVFTPGRYGAVTGTQKRVFNASRVLHRENGRWHHIPNNYVICSAENKEIDIYTLEWFGFPAAGAMLGHTTNLDWVYGGARNVWVLADNDAGGITKAQKVVGMLGKRARGIILMPEGMKDANDAGRAGVLVDHMRKVYGILPELEWE